MTLIVELIPTEEAQLRHMVAARGEDETRFVTHALRIGVAALAEEDALDPDTVTGIEEGLAQMDAGRGRSFTEFVAEVQAARQTV